MIGIKAIAGYLPEGRIDNVARAASLGSTSEQIEARIGFRELAFKGDQETTSNMAEVVLQRLLRETGLTTNAIEALIVVTQNPDRNLPHLSAELHGVMDLPERCACFDISLGCSGYVYGLSVLSAFMAANGLHNGVLVTADPYSKIVDQTDKNTSLLFGDGACATLLSDDEPRFGLGRFTFGTMGREADKLTCNAGVLHMNGRAVFNFAATRVPPDIMRAIAENDLSVEQIDRFVLHQGSRFIVESVADRLGVPPEKVPFAAGQYGNTISSSIPMVLRELLHLPEIRHIVISGFGVGFSWSSTILKRER